MRTLLSKARAKIRHCLKSTWTSKTDLLPGTFFVNWFYMGRAALYANLMGIFTFHRSHNDKLSVLNRTKIMKFCLAGQMKEKKEIFFPPKSQALQLGEY